MELPWNKIVTPVERSYGNSTAPPTLLIGCPPFLCPWNPEGQLQPKAVHLEPLLRLVGSQWSGASPSGAWSEKVLSEPISNSGSWLSLNLLGPAAYVGLDETEAGANHLSSLSPILPLVLSVAIRSDIWSSFSVPLSFLTKLGPWVHSLQRKQGSLYSQIVFNQSVLWMSARSRV